MNFIAFCAKKYIWKFELEKEQIEAPAQIKEIFLKCKIAASYDNIC
jgi:hypothetical protein